MAIHIENDALAVSVVTTAETLALFVSTAAEAVQWYPGESPLPVPTRIIVTINMTPGTGTTQINARVRHGNGVAGAVIGPGGLADDTTAGIQVEIPIDTQDLVGDLVGYSITVQQTGATANGTVNAVSVDLLDVVT